MNKIKSLDDYIPDAEYLNPNGNIFLDRLTLPADLESLDLINQVASDFLYKTKSLSNAKVRYILFKWINNLICDTKQKVAML